MSIDPTTPINPGQGRLPEISLVPSAIQRVTPDQQRSSPDDRQQAEEEPEESFDELLDEAEADGESILEERRARGNASGEDDPPGPHIDITA